MQNFHALTDPHLVTPTGDFTAQPPKGEPVAAPSVEPVPTVCDPRDLLVSEFVHRPEVVEPGDFIAAHGWTRPRLVEFKDSCETGHILFLADPDDSRTNRHRVRRLTREDWDARGEWRRYPNLRKVWEAAHKS